MAPKRENESEDVELARVSREVRDRDERPRPFDLNSIFFRGGQLVLVIGAVWGMSAAFSNYNYRLDRQQKEIDRLKRQVVYTSEWRAWREVFQLTNVGKIIVPDPKDYTGDRTE
jgi:hypothetical protein